MYNVSDAYLEAISQSVRTFKIAVQFIFPNASKGQKGEMLFDDSTIKGEVKIESQMVSGSASCGTIDVGAVTSATATLTVIDADADIKKYYGAFFTIRVSLLLENGEFENIPMGKFYCDTSKMSRIGNQIEVFGYDAMNSLNTTLTEFDLTRLKNKNVWGAAVMLTEYKKCEFDQDLSDLPNSDLLLDFSSTQIVTTRDAIMWIAQLMGCFARINRENHLEFVPIKLERLNDNTSSGIASVRKIDHFVRYKTRFSDDQVRIVGLSMPDDNNKLITRGGSETNSGSNVVISLEKNPLIDLSKYSLEDVLDNILNQLGTAYIQAFNAEIASDPALEAGDTVRLTGGMINGTIGNEIVGFITHNTWRYRGRHEIINTGQAPAPYGETDPIDAPQAQSDKLLASLSGKTNEIAESVGNITNIINNGLERAKYLQTFNGSYYDTATALRTTHSQRYSDMGGSIGYEFAEQTNDDYSAWNAMISSKMEYQKVMGDALTRHPIADIYYNWNIKPAEAIDGTTPDGINIFMAGHSEGVSFSASAELSCDGLWVSDGLPGTVPYDKVQMFSARYIHSYTEHIQEFVIANVIFTVMDDGIHITQPATSFGFGGKAAVIPWRSSGDTSDAEQSAQPEAQKAQTMSVKGAASGSEPSYTYDEDGIHISYNGHTKVIPWDT